MSSKVKVESNDESNVANPSIGFGRGSESDVLEFNTKPESKDKDDDFEEHQPALLACRRYAELTAQVQQHTTAVKQLNAEKKTLTPTVTEFVTKFVDQRMQWDVNDAAFDRTVFGNVIGIRVSQGRELKELNKSSTDYMHHHMPRLIVKHMAEYIQACEIDDETRAELNSQLRQATAKAIDEAAQTCPSVRKPCLAVIQEGKRKREQRNDKANDGEPSAKKQKTVSASDLDL